MRWKEETDFLASGLVLSFWSEDVGISKASGLTFASSLLCKDTALNSTFFFVVPNASILLAKEMFVLSEEQQTELNVDLQPPAV